MPDLMLEAERAGADGFHFDISDGCFAPNLTFGPWLLKDLRALLSRPFEAHLMVNGPERYYHDLSCCAETVYFHPEASAHPMGDVEEIHDMGMRAGIALAGDAPLNEDLLAGVEVVLLLLVKPGFSGQAMQQGSLERVKLLRRIRDGMKAKFEIAVDGGVKPENAASFVGAGAQRLVSGSGIFGSGRPFDSITRFRDSVG